MVRRILRNSIRTTVDTRGLIAFSLVLAMVTTGFAASKRSRGYVTTPTELKAVRAKADRGIQPYRSAVSQLLTFASTASPDNLDDPVAPNPEYWPFPPAAGKQECHGSGKPLFLAKGSPLVQAKAFAYVITGDNRYAADVRKHLLELAGTDGYGGEEYSGGNQCILNLSWYLPGWIIAADLIEDYKGWSAADKRTFQEWLATEAYRKVEWASDHRSNNWGSAGSATAAMIADYLNGSGIALVGWDDEERESAEAFERAKRRQIDRLNGNLYMDNYGCPDSRGEGIRPDGGIPWELGRGKSRCSGRWIVKKDDSWTYTMTFLQGALMHAELLLRRGDRSLYDNVTPEGAGSILKAIHFVVANPNNRAKSVEWKETAKPQLEFAYRYYRDPAIGRELRVGQRNRYIGRRSVQMLHFGTLTHGFSPEETASSPPTIPPPGAQLRAGTASR